MIEQKLDRIIELLEMIASEKTAKRKTRAELYEPENIIQLHIDKLKGKMSFDEVCAVINVSNNGANRVRFGSALTRMGIRQTRDKHGRYYHFD